MSKRLVNVKQIKNRVIELLSEIYNNGNKRLMWLSMFGIAADLIFAVFNGYVGISRQSDWFGTLSAYYLLLLAVRVYIVRHKDRNSRKVNLNTGIFMIGIDFVLGGAVALLATDRGEKHYPGILIYAASAYTFYKVTLSIINIIKAGRQSKAYVLALRKVSHADALVSLLSLQAALFFTFGDSGSYFSRTFNAITGSAVWLIIFGIAIQTIYTSKKL